MTYSYGISMGDTKYNKTSTTGYTGCHLLYFAAHGLKEGKPTLLIPYRIRSSNGQ
jgi:hypothetical protein